MGAKEQAPSSRVQSVFGNWREIADQLGDPFERERIPLSKLRQMRRDPMLGFGLSFIKVPLIRSNWYINALSNEGPNPQIAAHADENLRRIFGSFVSQYMNSLDFGYQGVAKRFEFRIPSGTFVATDDTGTETEQPIWAEGGIEPIAWKPFVALRPEGCEPIWDKSTGEFFGIEYSPVGNAAPGSGGAQTAGGAGGTNKAETYKIDLPHSLWITNEKDANFGSIFGFPRLGYAYAYWWSYWFRWAIADRAFERKADPSVLVYHPDGEFINEDTGERMSYSEYALAIGERMRSGGVIAVPSEVYEDANGRGTMRQWEIGFTKDAANFEPFDKSFEYLDVQKLRSLFIPEQAFMEGKGGTSSRNVASTLGGAFVESQDVLARQVVDHINRWLMPQWVAANYPEFQAVGGKAEVVMQGFASEDNDFMLQIVQLIGQQESGMQEIMKLTDIKKILSDRGTPITSFAEQQRREAEVIAAQQAQIGPAAPSTGLPAAPGTSLLPTATVPTATTTGFSYYAPREQITLADTGTSFIENLPDTRHFDDVTVKGFARQLWNLWFQLYRDEYESASRAIREAADVQLSDEDLKQTDDDLTFAVSKRVKKLLEDWHGSPRWDFVLGRSKEILSSIMKRAGRLEVGRLRQAGKISDDAIEAWVDRHLPDMVAKAQETCRSEIEVFLNFQLQSGVTDVDQLAASLRQHFSDFPNWKADRLARTEVTETYNAATLYAGETAGATSAQAIDNLGSLPPDPDCEERDGKIFTISDAFKEREHPNGTLAWRILPAELSISYGDVDGADLDEETKILTLSLDLSSDAQKRIIADAAELVATW